MPTRSTKANNARTGTKSKANKEFEARSAKRKADGDVDDETNPTPLKKRRQGDQSVRSQPYQIAPKLINAQKSLKKQAEPEDEDDGFTFTRPITKAKKAQPAEAPTRSSPRNHNQRNATTSIVHATPKPTKRPKDSPIDGRTSDSFVALPVSDTPIIRKNKELRGDGKRRSSLSLRGKRASSMSNTFQSLPHPDIPTSEFYKHIKEDLPDPMRMRQLLVWCARRCIDESRARPPPDLQPTDEQLQAINIARTIEGEVLKDLIDKRIETSWYNQPEQPSGPVTKTPHPHNVSNAVKMKEMEEKIAKLKSEEEVWLGLLADATSHKVNQQGSTDTHVDLDLLPAQEAEFVHALSRASQDVASPDLWLQESAASLEFRIDSLFHAVHAQTQFLSRANEISTQNLARAAELLASVEKKESATRGIGPIDVLRQISRGK